MMKFSKLLICGYLFVVLSITLVESYIGMTWGRMASQRMIPSVVVDMILQNEIRHVKLFSSSWNVLQALAGTDIEVTITVPNDNLKNITSVNSAREFLSNKVAPGVDIGVKIRYITVGSQPFSAPYLNLSFEALKALEYFQIALKDDIYADKGIKATMSHYTDILVETTIPSQGDFHPLVKESVIGSCRLLQKDNAPVWLDILPIQSVRQLFKGDLEFAFFDNNSPSKFKDGGNTYNNLFEVIVDIFISALRKVGISDMKIIVGQVGWPTDGAEGANERNAERFYDGLIKHILGGKGTPLHPDPINAFVYNLVDESKLNTKRGDFIRHSGIYKSDGNPKFYIDFTGKGQQTKVITGKGITHMPKRWCVFNNKSNDLIKIKKQYDFACNVSDCTTMSPGGSCTNLKFPHNISYAFNIYFQSKNQKVSEFACEFDGLAVVVPVDPSIGTCSFPVQIISSEISNVKY